MHDIQSISKCFLPRQAQALPARHRASIVQPSNRRGGDCPPAGCQSSVTQGWFAHADSLGAIRKAVSKTQSEMGVELGMPQNAISQLEKRSDLLVSTLVRYVDALGAELDLVVRMKDGSEIVLEGFGKARKVAKKSVSPKKSTSRSQLKAA